MYRNLLKQNDAHRLFICCAIMSSLGALSAQANPFHIGRFGGIQGNGASHRSPFATYWNPAGLVDVGLGLQLHGMLVGRQATFDRDASLNGVPDELSNINAGLSKTTALGVVPAIAFQSGHDLGGWTLGLGIAAFVDRAGRTNWQKNFAASPMYPGAVDGPQRWSVINTELTLYNLGIGMGVEHVESGLSIGMTWFGTQTTLSTVRARTVNATDDVLIEGHLAEGRILFRDGESQGYTLVLGSQWQISNELRVGIAWQSPVTHQIKGNSLIQFMKLRKLESLRRPVSKCLKVSVQK